MEVLIVDDDRGLVEFVTVTLRRAGFSVSRAHDAPAVHRRMQEAEEPDLILLDINLGAWNGFDILKEIRSRSMVPVILLTGRASEEDKVAGLDGGADDYIIKPFDYPELAARLRATLRRPRTTLPTVLQVGDLRLDPATHTVWRGAIVLPLTIREFSLLRQLMLRAGTVVSRTELLEHVWDAHYDGTSNVVDAHVANLRRKLDLPGSPAPIETVRGVGFRLATPA